MFVERGHSQRANHQDKKQALLTWQWFWHNEHKENRGLFFGEKENLSTHRDIFPSLWSIYLYTYLVLLKRPIPPGPDRAPSWVPCSVQQLPTNCLCYTWSCIYGSVYVVRICQWFSLWSPHTPLPTWCPQLLSLCPQVLYVRVSLPTLQVGSSVPFFLDSAYMHWYDPAAVLPACTLRKPWFEMMHAPQYSLQRCLQ